MKVLRTMLIWLLAVVGAPSGEAALTPAQAAAEIDAVLAADWNANVLTANEPISDEGFVRRIFIDLAGRIPTPPETLAFLDSTAPDKRARLIDDLLTRESYVASFFPFWADILRYKSRTNNTANVVEAAYGKYLKDSLRSNKRYDQWVRELLGAKGYAWDNGAIGYYHRDPGMPLDNMAISARIFLGTRIECAQCHDHPFEKWKQTEFYQLAAFTHAYADPASVFGNFKGEVSRRTEEIDRQFHLEKAASTDKGQEALARKEAAIAALENRGLTNVIKGCVGQLFSPIELQRNPKKRLKLPEDFEEGDGKPGDVMLPATMMGEPVEVGPADDPAEVFARWVASPQNPRFTTVAVNRLWNRFFGVPVIDGFDDLKDESAPMVPALEACLERVMIEQGYDLKAFIAAVVNTRAYQSAAVRDEFVRGSVVHFQGPQLRRMTAEQIWDSLVALASYQPDARNKKRAELDERRINVSRMACDAYLAFDGKELFEIARRRLGEDIELSKRELEVKAAMVEAKRTGDAARVKQLGQEEGELAAARGQRSIDQIILPMVNNLARLKGGVVTVDTEYKGNTNPRLMQTEAWWKLHVTGYGPAPKSAAAIANEADAAHQAIVAQAEALGIPAASRDEFVKFCEKGRSEWLRAAELDSPAPRGHFLRLMGQSDRDFVENSSTAAAIPQALVLMNSDLISPKGLLNPHSPLMRFVTATPNPREQVDAAYLALFSRKATAAEHATWERAAANGLRSIDDLLYALLNTKQFIFIQ